MNTNTAGISQIPADPHVVLMGRPSMGESVHFLQKQTVEGERSSSLSLLTKGARLVLAGRDPSKLEPLATSIGGRIVEADATRFEDVARSVDEALAWTTRPPGSS